MLRSLCRSAFGVPRLITLYEDFAASPDLELQPLRQSINNRNADAMKSARNFVGVVIELAAGVKFRQYNFGSRLPSFGMISVGMPRPLSMTVTELSMWMLT